MDKIKNFIKLYYGELIIIIIGLFICFFPIDCYIYRPGSGIDLSKRVTINGESDSSKYYLSFVGTSKANIPTYLLSFLIDSWDRVPTSDMKVGTLDIKTSELLGKFDMDTSINNAILYACNLSNYCDVSSYEISYYIYYIFDEADTNLKILDKILSVDGYLIDDIDLKEYINNLDKDSISIKVLRDNKEVEVTSKIYEDDNQKYIGVLLYPYVEGVTNPVIEVTNKNNEEGASGGLMLTLAIYDALDSDDLSKGKVIMGTGTLEDNGKVGEIGGIKYKMLGAKKVNADVFFCPKDNYEEALEVYNKYKLKFDLVMVETVEDAINYLKNM